MPSVLSNRMGQKLQAEPGYQNAVSKRNPQFFLDNPDELISMLQQKSKAQFAGFDDQLRETLADAGLLQSGAYGTGLAQGRIAQTQGELGIIGDVYQRELASKRQFDVQRALQLIEQDFQQKMMEDQQQHWFDQAIGSVFNMGGNALGGYLGGMKPRRPTNPMFDY